MKGAIGKVIISEKQIQERAAEIGREISQRFSGEPLVVVGLLNGCVPFLAELLKHLTIDVRVDFIKVKSYYGGMKSGDLKIVSDLDLDITDQNVLLVDDVADSGKTLVNISKLLLLKGAKQVSFAVLLNKPSAHQSISLDLDYVGFKIGNEFVVGFGLDFDERFRNLPYIAIFEPEID